MSTTTDSTDRSDEDAVLCGTCGWQVDAFGHDPQCPEPPYWPNPLKRGRK